MRFFQTSEIVEPEFVFLIRGPDVVTPKHSSAPLGVHPGPQIKSENFGSTNLLTYVSHDKSHPTHSHSFFWRVVGQKVAVHLKKEGSLKFICTSLLARLTPTPPLPKNFADANDPS